MTSTLLSTFPEKKAERDNWILSRRPQRNVLDPSRPYAFFVEDEVSGNGEVVSIATIFLTNRECPWRCLMCDLWKNTLTETLPIGAIPTQIEYALDRLPAARQVKLYNSGSFFDPQAIPLSDYPAIASRTADFERVIVESHPALIGDNCFRFQDEISGRLEVAIGLETANPIVLEKLNKRVTLQQFAAAAEKLREREIDLRVFILVKPPFTAEEEEALAWARSSVDFAFDCGATAVTLIPTRGGNGAMDDLARSGDFSPPSLVTFESSVEHGLSVNRGRTFADVWDVDISTSCEACADLRIQRLVAMNLQQQIIEPVHCEVCG